MFPQKNWIGRPKGWKDVGETKREFHPLPTHGWCQITLRYGYENENMFIYCPKCLVRFNPPTHD